MGIEDRVIINREDNDRLRVEAEELRKYAMDTLQFDEQMANKLDVEKIIALAGKTDPKEFLKGLVEKSKIDSPNTRQGKDGPVFKKTVSQRISDTTRSEQHEDTSNTTILENKSHSGGTGRRRFLYGGVAVAATGVFGLSYLTTRGLSNNSESSLSSTPSVDKQTVASTPPNRNITPSISAAGNPSPSAVKVNTPNSASAGASRIEIPPVPPSPTTRLNSDIKDVYQTKSTDAGRKIFEAMTSSEENIRSRITFESLRGNTVSLIANQRLLSEGKQLSADQKPKSVPESVKSGFSNGEKLADNLTLALEMPYSTAMKFLKDKSINPNLKHLDLEKLIKDGRLNPEDVVKGIFAVVKNPGEDTKFEIYTVLGWSNPPVGDGHVKMVNDKGNSGVQNVDTKIGNRKYNEEWTAFVATGLTPRKNNSQT